MMKVKVILKDGASADGNHLTVGKVFDVVSTDATGFYVIDGNGKVYRTSASLDNDNVWEVVSASHVDGEEVYKKPSPAKTAPAKHADTPDHKEPKSSHRAHGPGHKE